ncbi:MAG: asparaginase [Symbiobacteriia bacterium]
MSNSCKADLLVEVTRGSIVESRHYGYVAVVDSTGELLYQAGDPQVVTYLRSSAKPIQALPVIETGAADRFGFDALDLAMVCASHSASVEHTTRVVSMLEKLGLAESALMCGPHFPYDPETTALMQGRSEKPTARHSNCSGKHTGMLAIARQLDVPVEGYLDPAHPVQQRVIQVIAEVFGVPREAIAIGTDGCGVPVFGMPVRNMALGFARFAEPTTLGETRGQAATRLRDAMRANPFLVAGKGRLDTDLMQLAGDRLFSKGGAEGVHCIGILPGQATAVPEPFRSRGLGIAIKADDGGGRGSNAAVVETLRQLGVLSESEVNTLATYRVGPVKNLAGKAVGEIRPAFTLAPVAVR